MPDDPPATLPPIGSRRARWGGGIASLLLLGGCTSLPGAPPAADSADAAAIRSARYAQNEAIAVGDLDGIAAFWTEDVMIRPSLGGPIIGRAAYRQAFATDTPGVVFVRTPEQITVSDHWPLAFESGTWTWHLGGTQSPPIVTGRYSAQWVKRDGRWLIRSEVFVPMVCQASGCELTAAP